MSPAIRKVIVWILSILLLLYAYNVYHSAIVVTTGTYILTGFAAAVGLGMIYLALNFDKIYAKNMAQAKQNKVQGTKGLKTLGILLIVVSFLDLLINLGKHLQLVST